MSVTLAVIEHKPAQVATSRAWADHYRTLGFNVIPSRPDEKRPLVRWKPFAEQGRPVPKSLFERFATANMQVACGRPWGVIAVDLDGPEAIEHWDRHFARHAPRTWVTHSGGDGRHLWFSVPRTGDRIASGRLWGEWDPAGGTKATGDWCRRKNIEPIADGKLLMAPPSIHPKTGRTYRFVGGASPREHHRPAPAPSWLLGLPLLKPPARIVPDAPLPALPGRPLEGPPRDFYDRRDVLASIHDKAALVRSWGLRLAGSYPNQDGWVPCHRIGAEDANPSAMFSPRTGNYWDHTLEGLARPTLGLFDLGVELGVYRDWREAIGDLGARYMAPRRVPA